MNHYSNHQHYHVSPRRKYGVLNALIDITLTFLTGGLWLIWIIIRYLRTH